VKLLLAPAVALIRSITTPQRFLVMALLYGLPLAVALWRLFGSAGAADRGYLLPGALTAGLVFGLYLVLCWHVQASGGFRGVYEALERLSGGDLEHRTERVHRGLIWNLAYQLDDTRLGLAQAIGQIRASAEVIDTAAKEIAAGHVNLSRRTEEQTSTLERTAAGMQALAGTVKQNAQRCEQANALSQSASEVAQKGAQTVSRAVERMGLIDQSSRKVVDIIGVIEGIAFQTNILALNAAVEAARAGEQGRGFAVVAAEVRALAQRSAEAAKQIKALIEESAASVREGGKLVGEAGTIISEIVSGVQKVTELIAQIARASREQSAGVEEVNKAIVQLEDVTQQNAALVEQAAAATLSFEEAAQQLATEVSRFKFTGQSAAPRSAPTPGRGG
jgi:methyl-accepting chemotaxis protein